MLKLKSFDEEKNLLLTDEIQRESNKYLEELNKLDKYGKEVAQKKLEAEKQIPSIKNKIALLNAEYYRENDPEKLKEIEEKRLMLRLKLEDLEGLVNTNIKAIINQKFLKDLEGYEDKAKVEKLMFEGTVRAAKEQYFELMRQVEDKIRDLTLIEHMHSYDRALALREGIKNMDYIQDSGWVGSARDTRNITQAIVTEHGVYGLEKNE